MKSKPWRKYVNYCAICGKVGPRCWLIPIGLVHKYCMSSQQKKQYKRYLQDSYARFTAAAAASPAAK